MNDLGTARSARCLAVWGATTVAVVVAALWCLPDLPGVPTSTGQASFERLLVQGSALVVVLCAGWWWVVTTVVVLEALVGTTRGRCQGSARGVPAPVRRWVLAACGVAVLSGGLSPAHATPGSVHRDDRPRDGVVTLDGLPLPERPSGGIVAPSAPRPDRVPRETEPTEVVVRPGDSLWTIAATALGPGADSATVTAYWQRIHLLNRRVVGADPDVILPGQHLALPRPTPPRGES